jgi:hypothetical protein
MMRPLTKADIVLELRTVFEMEKLVPWSEELN